MSRPHNYDYEVIEVTREHKKEPVLNLSTPSADRGTIVHTISTHVAAIDIASVAVTADPAAASNFVGAAD
jgi:hypothetical protein